MKKNRLAVIAAVLGVGAAALTFAPATAAPMPSTPVNASYSSVATEVDLDDLTDAEAAAINAYPHCNTGVRVNKKSNSSEYAYIPKYGTTYNCILEVGNNNTGVKWLQNHLNRCYGKNLTTDGIFGTGTYNALISAQKTMGVSADGVYGPGTRAAMKFFASDITCNRITSYVGF